MLCLPCLLANVLLLIVQNTKAEIPGCNLWDTVDISSGQRLSNGSYLYEGLLIPANLTGNYDTRPESNEKVSSHLRGCVCQLKPCIRFCCDDRIIEYSKCYGMTKKELDGIDPYLKMTLNDGSVVRKYFKTDLIVQWDLPVHCDSMYNQTKRKNDFSMNKREYCEQHFQISEDPNSTRIVPYNCLPTKPSKIWQTVVMIISLICMILTISVYLMVKKLRNLHGKCFICYIVCLFMAYLFLVLDLWDLSNDFCITAGFLGYFFAMATFFWLSVISLHLYNTICGNSAWFKWFLPDHRFLAYNTYAWGMTFALTLITFIANKVVKNVNWNPRVGFKGDCWVYTYDWSAVIYFYGPMIFLIAFNIIMFILTAYRVMMVKRELRNITQRSNSDNQTYIFFLRLVIIMGISWSFEIIFYLVQGTEFWSDLFLVADYLNWSQGINLFVLFILKPSTFKLIRNQIALNQARSTNKNRITARGSTSSDKNSTSV